MPHDGLPRAPDTTRPREAFTLLVLSPVEQLTTALRRGDPFSAGALADMRALRNRLEAFADALDAREAVLEDD